MSTNNNGTGNTTSSLEGLRVLEANLVEVLDLLEEADRLLVEGWQALAPADPAEGRIEEAMGAVFAPVQELEKLLEEVRARMA